MKIPTLASAAATSRKHTPKVAPDNAAKQEALKSATAGTAKGHTGAASDASAKAANDKTPRAEVPAPRPARLN